LLAYAQRSNEKWYNAKREERHFAKGKCVLLRAKDIMTRRPSKKFDAKYVRLLRISYFFLIIHIALPIASMNTMMLMQPLGLRSAAHASLNPLS
jgi:hypothetical protein